MLRVKARAPSASVWLSAYWKRGQHEREERKREGEEAHSADIAVGVEVGGGNPVGDGADLGGDGTGVGPLSTTIGEAHVDWKGDQEKPMRRTMKVRRGEGGNGRWVEELE